MKQSDFMKQAPIFPLLAGMSFPMVISMLVNSLYNIIDSLFVARISEDALTALSLVFPVQNLVNAIAVGYGVGINAMISLYLGAGNRHQAKVSASHGLVGATFHGILVSVLCFAGMPAFLRMFTDDPVIYEYGITYSRIVFLFSPIVMWELVYEKIFQAAGRMNVSMLSLLIGCVANIILDPLLIWGVGFFPALGISGAAIATGLGQVISLAVYIPFCMFRPAPVSASLKWFSPDRSIFLRLYAIGIPAALNMALPSLLISCLNSLLGLYSQAYVVILGIYYKLQTFLYLPANGIIQGMRPLIGYNYGAGESKRVKRIYMTALCMAGCIMAAGTVLCQLFPEELIGMFTENRDIISGGAAALKTISTGFLVSAVSITSCGALEGLGKGVSSLVISLLRYVVVILPCAFILCKALGPETVWNAFWITELLAAISSFIIFSAVSKKS